MHCFHILCCLVSIQAALDFQFVEKLEKGWEFNVKLMLKNSVSGSGKTRNTWSLSVKLAL